MSLADIVLSYDYVKDVEERRKKSPLMRLHENFRASTSFFLKDFTSNSDSAKPLKSFRYFHPTEKKTLRCSKYVGFIAKKLRVAVSKLEVLDDELKLFQLEKDPDLTSTTKVYGYWVNLLCCEDSFGDSKYPNLAGVVKAAFCLSHGSANVERGF